MIGTSVVVTLQTPDGQRGSATITVYPPLTVTGVSPTSGPATGGYDVTFTGTGFQSGMSVLFGTRPSTNVRVSEDGTSLVATMPSMV